MNQFYDAMHEVLQGSQYDILTGRATDWQQVITEAIEDALIAFFSQFDNFYWSTSQNQDYNLDAMIMAFRIVAIILLIAAVVGGIYWFLRRKRQAVRPSGNVADWFDDISQRKLSFYDLVRKSKECAANGEFRGAIRHRYLAVLVALHESNAIQVDKSKTNAQLAHELQKARPQLATPFGGVVEVFQQAWFGRKPLDEETWLNYQQFAESCESSQILQILHDSHILSRNGGGDYEK